MKKIITVGLLVLIGLTSLKSNAQLGNLLNKKDKKSSNNKKSKEVLIEDEPGTIFGNYYFKFLPPTDANEAIVESAKGQLPADGETIQIKRWE